MNRIELIAAMQAAAAKCVPVDVKGWGGTVYVRSQNVAEVELQRERGGAEEKISRIARNACGVLCDEHGVLLFNPENDEDVQLVARQPWPFLESVLVAVNTLNAHSKEGIDETKNG